MVFPPARRKEMSAIEDKLFLVRFNVDEASHLNIEWRFPTGGYGVRHKFG